jgi:hypothetical protein
MHRSKRVGVGTRPAVNRDEISTPWKRSKNRLVQDEWRLQSGALSPTHTGRGKQRAHTAQGFERAQSPNLSNLSGHSGHHPVDKLQIEGSLRNLTQASLFSRSPSHAETRPPTLWAQDRYFMAPKSQVCPLPVQVPLQSHSSHGPLLCPSVATRVVPTQMPTLSVCRFLALMKPCTPVHSQRTHYGIVAKVYLNTARFQIVLAHCYTYLGVYGCQCSLLL